MLFRSAEPPDAEDAPTARAIVASEPSQSPCMMQAWIACPSLMLTSCEAVAAMSDACTGPTESVRRARDGGGVGRGWSAGMVQVLEEEVVMVAGGRSERQFCGRRRPPPDSDLSRELPATGSRLLAVSVA